MRVWACGPFQVEYRARDGFWKTVEPHEWGKNAHSRHVLRYLLLYGRSAGRGTLMNAIWPGNDSLYLDDYLSKAVSNLRKVLRAEHADGLVRTKNERTLYELADQTLIWTDMDACEIAMQEAERLGYTSAEGCRLLETAQTYLARGRLFEGEDGLWCHAKRDMFETAQYRCILWLAEAYEVQGQVHRAEAQIEKLLHKNPLDETALTRLLLLLHKQGMATEASRRYKNAAALFAKQGMSLSPALEELAHQLAGKVQQEYIEQKLAVMRVQPMQRLATLPTVLHSVSEPGERSALAFSSTNLALLLPLEVAPQDSATWLGVRLAYLLNVIQHWHTQASACDRLQALLDQEITMFEHVRETSAAESFTLSRRQALISLAALPTMLTALMQGQSLTLIPEEFLPQCAASLTACWHLLRGQEVLLVENVLTRYLPILADLAHQPTVYQTTAASLATQGYRLMGLMALHRNNPHERIAYQKQAAHFAEITGTPNFVAATLLSLAYYQTDPAKASVLYQRGLSFKQALSPLVLSHLYARLSVVSAQQGEEEHALHYLEQAKTQYPDHPETDPGFLYGEFDPASLIMEEGLMYLSLAQQGNSGYAERAWETFAQIEHWRSSVPFLPVFKLRSSIIKRIPPWS